MQLFVGDLTVTYERSQAVEFSFLTLADNEAFLTHAPSLLNEALALVRSFHWKVSFFFDEFKLLYYYVLPSIKSEKYSLLIIIENF